jgi:hypothetical protein
MKRAPKVRQMTSGFLCRFLLWSLAFNYLVLFIRRGPMG